LTCGGFSIYHHDRRDNLIGVICDPREEPAVRELFELFKTPWAMFDPEVSYDAIIVSGDGAAAEAADARLAVRFGAGPRDDDGQIGIVAEHARARAIMSAEGAELPLFRGASVLAGDGDARALLAGGSGSLVLSCERDGRRVIRCGYDLLAEVEFLLTEGQPAEHAGTPTLDLHIALLRQWLIEAGLELVELAPTPPGCALLATLTHDIDFHGIRRHTRDRTLVGFLYRATIGSAIDLIRGRGSARRLVRNWCAVLSLPLVHAGLIEDFWLPFDRYHAADSPWRSTFFIVPFRDRPGVSPTGATVAGRAVPYGAAEIEPEIRALAERGHEIALHGIDAWRSTEQGVAELATVRKASGADVGGVRMHWLYFDRSSFDELDAAGFDYDATWGYNDTVGFRAGTSQVFSPLGVEHLLELPLQIQDTSLLYPGRMHCREPEAAALSKQIVDTVCRTGGVATISWHERSLSPERLWGGVYRELLSILRARGASVRPAREVVSWFRLRRGIDLEGVDLTSESVSGIPTTTGAQSLRVRVHHCPGKATAPAGYTDLAVAASDLEAAARGGRLVRS
jgi:hypothetical protein